MNIIEEFESEREDDARIGDIDVNDARHIYHDETWRKDYSLYAPRTLEFQGSRGIVNFMNVLSTIFASRKINFLCQGTCHKEHCHNDRVIHNNCVTLDHFPITLDILVTLDIVAKDHVF